MLHRRCRGDDVSGSEGRAAVDQLVVGERLKRFADPARRIDEQRLERGHRGTAGLDGRIAGDLDLADHLCRPVGALRNAGCDTGQHRPRGGLGVEDVALAVVAPHAPVATVDLDDAEPLAAHETGETDPIGTGALDPEGVEFAERARPSYKVGVAGTVCSCLKRRETRAQVLTATAKCSCLWVSTPTITLTDGSSRAMLFDRLLASFTGWRRRLVGRMDNTVTGLLARQAPIRSDNI